VFLRLEWQVSLPPMPEQLEFPQVRQPELPVWLAQQTVQVPRTSLVSKRQTLICRSFRFWFLRLWLFFRGIFFWGL
jgi:hypothetical protein